MKKLFLFFFLFITSHFAQQYEVSGTVLNISTSEPLPFATIIFNDGKNGTTSDIHGSFKLNLDPGSYTLLVSYIGYKIETIKVNVDTTDLNINIKLTSTDVILQEVSVYASDKLENQVVSSISLQSKEMKKITSIFPDAFRSIQSLPGIAANNGFSARYYVHGGNYDENLVLVNSTQVYEPFHLKEVENASIGIFNMDMMKKVSLITGGFSAHYGDRLSSVLNIEYREGNKEKYTGSATVGVAGIDGIIEGPIFSNSSFILGFRKSYVKYIMDIIDYKKYIDPDFYDVQGVFTFNLSDKDKLQIMFIHAGDDFKLGPKKSASGSLTGSFRDSRNHLFSSIINKNTNEDNKAKYYSNLFDIHNTLFISKNALLNTSFSYYGQIDQEDFYYINQYREDLISSGYPQIPLFYSSNYETIFKNNLTIKTLEGKASLDAKPNPYYNIKTGVSYIYIQYRQSLIDKAVNSVYENYYTYPDTVEKIFNDNFNTFPPNISVNSFKVAAYFENVVQLTNNFIVNAGGRMDYFNFNHDINFSPRLNISYLISNGLNLRGAWGYYYQSPIYRQLAYWFEAGSNTQSQKSEQFVLSIEKNISLNSMGSSSTLKLEGYYKKYSDLISSERNPSNRIEYSRKNDSRGYAKGIDLYVSLNLPFYYGWVSYGYLITGEDLLTDNYGEFPRYTDQRHTLSLVNDFNLGKNWNINIRYTYGSGFAYTPDYARYDQDEKKLEWIKGKPNSEHMPPYKRIDLRINREFLLFDIPMQIFLDVNNLLNYHNVMSYTFKYDNYGNLVREENELWPIIPSVGLNIKF